MSLQFRHALAYAKWPTRRGITRCAILFAGTTNYNQTRMVLGCLLTILLVDENHHHSLICEVQIIIIAMQSVTDAQLMAGRTNSHNEEANS